MAATQISTNSSSISSLQRFVPPLNTTSSKGPAAAPSSFLSCLPFSRLISHPITNVGVRNSWVRPCNKPISRPHIDMDYSESDMRAGGGVSFLDIDDSCVVSMTLENGTSAKLMLPSGLITSFKPQMWHGATMELLHTIVSAKEEAGGALIRGGLSLALWCESESESDAGLSWSPNAWTLHRVHGSPQESIQVQLMSRNKKGDAQMKHIVTLQPDILTSEIVVHSSSTSSLNLRGSVICHLGVSTPDATYAMGLEGSDFFIRPPLLADFTIIPPDFNNRIDPNPMNLWSFNKTFSRDRDDVDNLASDISLEGEEDDNYKHLTQKLCRIYTNAPRALTIIDRGRKNSVTVRRDGFKEVYMLSPGSEHEWYNKYSYVCIGHTALLEPVRLKAQTEWRGQLQVFNPNS